MDFLAVQSPLFPAVMDTMLSYGYYRIQQSLFTTEWAHTDERQRVQVLWARVALDRFQPNHRHVKLTRLCRRFSCTLHDAAITPEVEALYAVYRAHIDFDGNPSVAACLLDDRGINYFPGRMWQLRDAGRLIAAGYFDEGRDSCAGILNFYHPAYGKYSPGLWLYLEGLRYAAETGKRWFYPGYVAMGFPKFDYKLLAGKERIEIWDPRRAYWMPYAASAHARQGQVTLLRQ